MHESDAKFWLETLKGINYPEDLGLDGMISLTFTLGKQGEGVWSGFIWLRIRTGDEVL